MKPDVPGQQRVLESPVDTQQDLEQQLRDKIRSKMDVAKILGGGVTVLLALFLDEGRLERLGDPVEVNLAAIAFITALLLFLATMDAYDSLLMPRPYWSNEPRALQRLAVTRRYSGDKAIYDAMVRVWDRLFLPAAVALTIGVILLADAALDPNVAWRLISGGAILIVLVYILAVRPVLLNEESTPAQDSKST